MSFLRSASGPGQVGLSVADVDISDLLYQPKTEKTAAAFGLLIKFVRRHLGFEHNSIINGAADEVLATMKNPDFDEKTRRSEVNSLLSVDEGLDDDDYNELCNLSKKITDWGGGKIRGQDEAGELGEDGFILPDSDDGQSDDLASEVQNSDSDGEDGPQLDDMFEKAAAVSDALNIEELAKKQTNIIPRVEIGEPIRKEGYQEYIIEPKKRSSQKRDNLIKIDELSTNEREAFKGLKSLNLIQSIIYRRAIGEDKSLLICAPTGAGKTNIAMLTMLREILKHPRRDGSGFELDRFKIVYIAPIKALVQEIVQNFRERLGRAPFNLTVEELTGDHQLDQRQISQAQLIVCTPEKWDIVTRKSLDRLYTKVVRLVIFDEIHLLHNERGATLEALVARIKRHKQIEGEPIRIVGLSATLPNYKDVARFISPDEPEDKSTFYFDSTYRPIPLKQQFIAMTESKRALKLMNEIVYDKVIERLIDSAQILIFVHSRPDTAKTADYIKNRALDEQKVGLFLSSESAVEVINEEGENVNAKLRELLQFGIGIHHAGMSKDERACVEKLFRERFIKVLVSTATLAWGVNLPARTVIIKGTQVYREGKWTDLDSLDVTQMLGRAGRPGYDREGEGIVITQQSQVAFYISLMTEQLPVESRLISRLAEFVNAECVVGNIESLEGAVEWLSETYLSSRMKSVIEQGNRQYMLMYGIKNDAVTDDPKLTAHKHNLAYNAACILDDRGLVVFDRSSGAIKSTELGRIAANYNCSSRTIKLFDTELTEHTSDIELFKIFSLADEFKDIFVRRGEEADLMTLLNQVPFPIDDKKATPGANKVNVLLQVYIFRLNIEGSDLICDMHFIKDNAARLARAIHEIVLMKGYANVAELSFDLCRKIDRRMTVCHSPLRQFPDLDADLVSKLEKRNYHLEELRVLNADKLAEVLRCHRRAGEKICKLLQKLPRLKIEDRVKPVSKDRLRIDLTITQDFTWDERYHGYSECFWLLVHDVNQEKILHYQMIYLRRPYKDEVAIPVKTTFYVQFQYPIHPFYFIKILPDKWMGCDQQHPLHIEKLTLPDELAITTQLGDMDLQRIGSLGDEFFEKVYEKRFGSASFNLIQTHAFKPLYKSNDDVVLLASAGSGKTTCAELAIIRNLNVYGNAAKCGYVAANAQAAQLVYRNWRKFFRRDYENVLLLSGKRREDITKAEDSKISIIIGDPESWHSLTLVKPKRYRKFMSKFQLFIVDDIHLLHEDYNSTLEWLCAKLRIITKLDVERTTRIIALGSPMASADSLKNWLAFERGAKEPVVLNYPPSMRSVKLELTIQMYQHYDYKMRLMTMQRPVYRHITQTTRGRPTMIFVADFHRARELCEILISYAKADKIRFSTDRGPQGFHEKELEDCIRYGIGYLYRGMHESDKKYIEDMYDKKRILILVVTVGMCWSIQSRAYLTILMDTQQNNGLEGVDYELTDVLQMIGFTGRPAEDNDCKCIVMCHSAKVDYYNSFLREPLPIESDLPKNLISHINYEVIVGTITELNNIYKPFLAHTYFYKRITINPNYYGVTVPEDQEAKTRVFGAFFNDLVNKVALELEKNEFMLMEGSHENPNFTGGLLARISLEYYINYETLLNYADYLKSKAVMSQMRSLELIEMISTMTYEYRKLQIRHGELGILKSLQRRYRPQETDRLQSVGYKIKLLILSQYQKTDGREDRLDGELIDDRYFIIGLSHRLLMAIVDIACLRDSFNLAKTALGLAKRLNPFSQETKPELDMRITKIDKSPDESDQDNAATKVVMDVQVSRRGQPFSVDDMDKYYRSYPKHLYRAEGWCFLINGQLRSKDKGTDKYLENEKFLHFRRVKTPQDGDNEYRLEFILTENAAATYTHTLYFMSDFYSGSVDLGAQLENL